jgi:hypothetical protein
MDVSEEPARFILRILKMEAADSPKPCNSLPDYMTPHPRRQ